MSDKTIQRTVIIAGQRFELSSSEVVHALSGVEPEPISAHYVVVAGRRFPPKQVISELTGLDRADFTSHQARRTLMRLGFSAGRRARAPRSTSGAGANAVARPERLADRLQDLAGQWVAIADDDVLHAAATPQELVGWLTRHGKTAESMFRVPEDELGATGLAPL